VESFPGVEATTANFDLAQGVPQKHLFLSRIKTSSTVTITTTILQHSKLSHQSLFFWINFAIASYFSSLFLLSVVTLLPVLSVSSLL